MSGHSGVQRLAPSHLVRHIPGARLRLAAKKLLGVSPKNIKAAGEEEKEAAEVEREKQKRVKKGESEK